MPLSPVNVLLRLLYRVNGTLKFTEVCSFFSQPTVMFAFVSCEKVFLNTVSEGLTELRKEHSTLKK